MPAIWHSPRARVGGVRHYSGLRWALGLDGGSVTTSSPQPDSARAGDPADIIYSSGTTGVPKGIVQSVSLPAPPCANLEKRRFATRLSLASKRESSTPNLRLVIVYHTCGGWDVLRECQFSGAPG